jgi:hypothetical protein
MEEHLPTTCHASSGWARRESSVKAVVVIAAKVA